MCKYENKNKKRKTKKGIENGVNITEIIRAVLIKVLSAMIC
jgi:hypothetical protein